MARPFSQEPRSDSHKIGETRYRMSHLPLTTAIARTLLLAGILLAVTVLAARSFFPASAQEAVNMNVLPADPIDFEENSDDSVAVYTASDPEGEDIVWSLLDAEVTVGTETIAATSFQDHGDFAVDGGVLSFKDGPPDYEDPKGGSANDSNTYNVVVVAKAGNGDETTMSYQPVVVTVTNVGEDGEIEFSLLQPKEERTIEATLKDPDGPPANAANIPADRTNLTDVTLDGQPIVTWQWATSSSDTGPWNDIDGATTHEYTPEEEDIGDYLQVRVVYSDGHAVDDPYTEDVDEGEDVAEADFGTLVILAKDYTNTPPSFKDEDTTSPNTKEATREVKENSAAGTEVGDPVAAVDLDDRKMQEDLTYELTGTGSNLFTIDGRVGDTRSDSEPGQIRVADGAALNTETTPTYELTVRATDPSGEDDEVTVTITVVNVDEPPVFNAASLAQTVIPFDEIIGEPNNPNLNVGTAYNASDPEGVTVTWYLDDVSSSRTADNEDNDKFTIDASTGQLSFLEAPNYEPAGNRDKNHRYRVTVKVRDATDNSASLPVQVLLGNLNEDGEVDLVLQNRQALPVFLPVPGIQIRAELDDEDDVKTSLRRTSYQWYRSSSGTGDVDTWDEITVSGTSQTYRPVADDPNDANDVPDEGSFLGVVVTYTDTTSVDANDIRKAEGRTDNRVTANSPNDPPHFEDGASATTTAVTVRDVSETTAVDTVITTNSHYSGQDDLELYYTIKSGDTNIFEINPSTGYLSLKQMLDFESKASHSVTITANDASLKTADLALTITVQDELESPVIEEGEAGTNSAVTHAEGDTSVVMTLNASDDDDSNVDPEIPLTWSLSGADSDSFVQSDLKGDSFDLQFTSAPDFEADNSYSVTVTVTDSDNSQDARNVVVTIDNVEEAGVVTLDTVTPKQGVVVTATLNDPDGNITESLWEWSHSDSKNGPWTPSTGENSTSTGELVTGVGVTPAGSRLTGTYTPNKDDVGDFLRALVTYTDDEDPDKSMEIVSESEVREEDYVNRRPRFEIPEGTIPATTTLSIYENLEPGSTVGELLATDTDEFGNDEVLEYSLSGTDAGSFDIGRQNGVLTVASTADLDYEDPDDVQNATGDDSTNATSSTETNPVTVTADAGDNNYHVVVTAEDPSGTTTDIVVIIKVRDVQEAPEINGATATDDPTTSVERPELSATHTVTTPQDPAFMPMIATYSAIDDEDDGDNVATTYVKWTLSGADAEQFQICDAPVNNAGDCVAPGMDTEDVELRFMGEPDFEMPSDSNMDNVYDVTLVATDSYGASSELEVTVTVTNVEETGAVKFTSRQPEVSIRLRAELTDPDGGIKDLEWQWSTGGTSADPNVEADWTDILGATTATYTPGSSDDGQKLRAIATYRDAASVDDKFTHDRDESIRTATNTPAFLVMGADNNNQAPVFPDQDDQTTGDQSERTTRSVREDARFPTLVGEPVRAIEDRDGDAARTPDNLTYTLGGPDAALFTIHHVDDTSTSDITEEEGHIRIAEGVKFDYETKTSYMVTVTATDPSLASDTITVIINILDVDEPPEVSKRGLAVSGSRSVSYAENGTGDVATYAATGSDAAGATWSLEGTDASAFAISSGILAFRSSPNYESPTDQNTDNAYEVTIKATMGSLMATRSVTVNVTNVDEPGSVSISSPNNEVKVGVELTAELDEGDEETVVGWQWASGGTVAGPWADISGATNNMFTPAEGDVGNYLRATVTYNDPLGSGKTLSEIAGTAVEAASDAGTPGTVSLSSSSDLVSGDSVSATLTDSDNPTNQVWQWDRSADGSTGWTTISGVTSNSYTTTDADGGYFLRARVTYDDDSGTGQTAGPVSTTGRVAINSYDADANGVINSTEVLAAVADYFTPNSGVTVQEVLAVVELYFAGLNQ